MFLDSVATIVSEEVPLVCWSEMVRADTAPQRCEGRLLICAVRLKTCARIQPEAVLIVTWTMVLRYGLTAFGQPSLCRAEEVRGALLSTNLSIG